MALAILVVLVLCYGSKEAPFEDYPAALIAVEESIMLLDVHPILCMIPSPSCVC